MAFLTRICSLRLLLFSLAARAGWPDKDHVEIESPKKVWVGGLLFEGDEWSEQKTRQDAIRRYFSKFGTVLNVESGKRCFAFVEFESPSSARRAVAEQACGRCLIARQKTNECEGLVVTFSEPWSRSLRNRDERSLKLTAPDILTLHGKKVLDRGLSYLLLWDLLRSWGMGGSIGIARQSGTFRLTSDDKDAKLALVERLDPLRWRERCETTMFSQKRVNHVMQLYLNKGKLVLHDGKDAKESLFREENVLNAEEERRSEDESGSIEGQENFRAQLTRDRNALEQSIRRGFLAMNLSE